MVRSKRIHPAKLRELLNIAEQKGYELKALQYLSFDAAIPDPSPLARLCPSVA